MSKPTVQEVYAAALVHDRDPKLRCLRMGQYLMNKFTPHVVDADLFYEKSSIAGTLKFIERYSTGY